MSESTKRKAPDSEDVSKKQKTLEEPMSSGLGLESSEPVPSMMYSSGKTPAGAIVCPYLDTVNRVMLDFDFEKLCSVSLRTMNVYGCLTCGKYFQGRGINTHAYNHSIETDHHVYMNLQNGKVYCLPDGYEVLDPSLADIQFNLHPTFTTKDLPMLENWSKFVHGLDGQDFLPGVVGLNNIKHTDWLSVIIQALCRVRTLRNFFLVEKNWASTKSLLVRRFGELLAKIFNPRSFKGHVSPHELLQAVMAASAKKYRVGVQSDPLEFLSFFLNTLHKDLGGTRKKNSSPVYSSFQGEIEIITERVKLPEKKEVKKDPNYKEKIETDKKKVNFLYLSLELPEAPLFKDSMERISIPQISLFELLNKFDGITAEVLPDGARRRYIITRLPKYLIIHVRRFKQNNWFREKNPTLVTFPISNLDLRPYTRVPETPTSDELLAASVADLKARCEKRKVDISGIVEKDEIVAKLIQHYEEAPTLPTKYDLIANIVHEGKPEKGQFKAHVYHGPTDTWFEMDDLRVWTTETMPQLVALSETYIQIYQLKSS